MSRSIVVALAVACTVLALTACAPGGRPTGAHSSLPVPQPRSSRSAPAPSATPSPSPAPRLSTTPGDELLTFTGTGHSTDGSVVAATFTVHAPVAWNSPAGTSTLAALAAAHTTLADTAGADLRNSAWDAANGVSLGVVDYSATMTSGSWHPGEAIEIDLGAGTSSVAVNSDGLAVEDGWLWTITRPGSGHLVIAYTNGEGSTPDPSTWADSLQMYGLGVPQVTGGTPASYQFHDCRIDITPLGRRSPAVAGWATPTPEYCYAGVGE